MTEPCLCSWWSPNLGMCLMHTKREDCPGSQIGIAANCVQEWEREEKREIRLAKRRDAYRKRKWETLKVEDKS